MLSMFKSLVRLLAFFGKEVNEVRRQPRLVLSLLLGPTVILLLFGIGYQGESPTLNTILVVPPERMEDPSLMDLKNAINPNFRVVDITADRAQAMRRLERTEVDVVEILPSDLEERVLNHDQASIIFKYNEINPLDDQWVQYLSYVQVIELNRIILEKMTVQMQREAGETKELLGDAREQLDSLDSNISQARRQETQQSLRRLKESASALALSPLLASQANSNGGRLSQTRRDLLQLRDDLEVLDRALAEDRLEDQQERIRQTRERITRLETALSRLRSVPPDVLVSPLLRRTENIRGASLDLMKFYAPGVVALILQHIAITLGALSLVRERLLGALEIYGVAPVSMIQVLFGKYLAYTMFLGFIAAALTGLMLLLQVPFLSGLLSYILLLLLFILASLGIGFFVSTLSASDSQAVQLSMLVLLLSIFFSGFFLPLESFWAPIARVGAILPLTHAIAGLQDLMLRGIWPNDYQFLSLTVIAVVTFVLTTLVWRRQFRRI